METKLIIKTNSLKFQRWKSSAPYRTITVRDIMSDLPEIRNGDQKLVTKYDGLPECHFQRMMRKNTKELTDHICKQVKIILIKKNIYFSLFKMVKFNLNQKNPTIAMFSK